MVYATTFTMIGDQIISLEEARTVLSEAFNIDHSDSRILKELGANQHYLELVVAAQITGKPRMGIEARTGATGRGMLYATLAAVANLYRKGKWEAAEPLDSDEESLVDTVLTIDVPFILKQNGNNIIGDSDWSVLSTRVFPKLLKGKTMVVQGSGKVGGSIIREMSAYGVNLIAVSDAGGAVIGDMLDAEEILDAVHQSRELEDRSLRASVVHARKNVSETIYGAADGARILELECDLLFPSALENAVTEENAPRIRTVIEICGSNGCNSSKAEKILEENGVFVLYDFLANSGGVIASYFEWLRNLYQRYCFEASSIFKCDFDDTVMDRYIMPEFRDRIKAILACDESTGLTAQWNSILRDIMFSSVNEDYQCSCRRNISLKNAGFVNSQFRVLAAALVRMDHKTAEELRATLDDAARNTLDDFLRHPEIELIRSSV